MESVNNDLVFGSRGRIGDMLVFRQRGGKTFISKRPKKKEVSDSEDQTAVKERFKEGVLYAKAVVDDPVRKAVYQAKSNALQSAYNLALADYFKAPEIKNIDAQNYTGNPGDAIMIKAVDDFKVDKVMVTIKDSSNNEIESGLAVLGPNGIEWLYLAKHANSDLVGSKLIIKASDLPGNVTTEEYIIEP